MSKIELHGNARYTYRPRPHHELDETYNFCSWGFYKICDHFHTPATDTFTNTSSVYLPLGSSSSLDREKTVGNVHCSTDLLVNSSLARSLRGQPDIMGLHINITSCLRTFLNFEFNPKRHPLNQQSWLDWYEPLSYNQALKRQMHFLLWGT